MSDSAPTTHREVERKLRVHGIYELPDLVESDVVARVERQGTFTMHATYHDTAALTLFRWGITLRRREGGSDEGWHMKLPVSGSTARDELHLPLDAGPAGSVPGAFIEIVAPLLREQPVAPVVHLSTQRTPTVVLDDDGRPLVELVDDVVTVRHQGAVVSVFRELELEAVDAESSEALEVIEDLSEFLIESGAEPNSTSKAASALGPKASAPPDVPDLPVPGQDDLSVDAIRAVLCRHVRHLLIADVGVRRDLPDSVHQMRVAARRLRSAFATFEPLLRTDEAQALRDELKWIANELGAIRDTEVMLERLSEHADDLAESDAELAGAAIRVTLERRLVAARASALAALRSDRHQQLVDDLISAAIDPPVTDEAYEPCESTLLPLVARTWKRLAKAVRELDDDGDSAPWHEARIKAKRARYAAESVAEVFGRRMEKLARSLEQVTEILGDHQDAHVAQLLLREISNESSVDGPTGLALGLLYEIESEYEMHDRRKLRRMWSTIERRARRAGVG